MDLWEYMSIVISAEDNQYVMRQGDGSQVFGLDAILNYWSPAGWELVAIVPIDYDGKLYFGTVTLDATRLFATFKRRKPPIAPYNLPQE